MAHPWEVSDEFWNLAEPLIPVKKRGGKARRWVVEVSHS